MSFTEYLLYRCFGKLICSYCVVVFGPCWTGMPRAHRATGIGTAVTVFQHIYHGHTEIHPQSVGHEEAIAG